MLPGAVVADPKVVLPILEARVGLVDVPHTNPYADNPTLFVPMLEMLP